MPTLESLRGEIKNARQLHQVTKTMKSLAAVNIRQYQGAVEAVATYFETVELGLQIVLRDRPAAHMLSEPAQQAAAGVVIIGSDQGLVGQFNYRVVTYAAEQMRNLELDLAESANLVIGHLAAATLDQIGVPAERKLDVPRSLAGITGIVQDVLFVLDEWRARCHIGQIILFYNSPRSGASYEPTLRRVLPVSPGWLRQLQGRAWESRVLPIYRMERSELFLALIRQYFFVSLYRAMVESLASENASRLQSMQAAERNIGDRLDQLNSQYHRLRQSSITEEVLDVAAGFEALRDEA